MKFINQLEKDDCLFTCLKNLLCILNTDSNYLYMPSLNHKGQYSFKEIIEIAKEHSLILEGFKVDSTYTFNDLPKQFIALIKENDRNHAVLIIKLHKRYVKFYDPSKGLRYCSFKKFTKIWDRKGLYEKSFEKRKLNLILPVTLLKKDKLELAILQILSAALVIVGTYTLSKNIPSFFPIILFSLFAITEVLYRSLCFKKLKSFDERMSTYIKDGFKENLYKRMEMSKAVSFNNLSSFIFNLIMTAFLIVLFIINNSSNFIIVGIIIVIALILSFVINPKLENYKSSLGDLENLLLKEKSKEQIPLLNKLHEKSYRYGYLCFIKRIISLALIFLPILVIIAINQSYTIVNAIFYLVIGYYLLENMEKIFSFDFLIMKERILKAQLVEAIFENDENSLIKKKE